MKKYYENDQYNLAFDRWLNLMAELICMLMPGIAQHLHSGGVFIASGILTEKAEMVKDAAEKAGLTLEELTEKGEWCAIVFRKQN